MGDFDALLRAARAGSGSALGELLMAFRPLLLDQAIDAIPDRLKGKSSPSDVAQNSLAEAVRDFAHFHGDTEAEWKTWLLAILRHNALGMIDRYLRHKREIAKEVPADGGPSLLGLLSGLLDKGPSPSGQALRDEKIKILEKALGHLPEDDCRVIVLRLQEDIPFAEVARLLGVREPTARKRFTCALERLRAEVNVLYGSSSPP